MEGLVHRGYCLYSISDVQFFSSLSGQRCLSPAQFHLLFSSPCVLSLFCSSANRCACVKESFCFCSKPASSRGALLGVWGSPPHLFFLLGSFWVVIHTWLDTQSRKMGLSQGESLRGLGSRSIRVCTQPIFYNFGFIAISAHVLFGLNEQTQMMATCAAHLRLPALLLSCLFSCSLLSIECRGHLAFGWLFHPEIPSLYLGFISDWWWPLTRGFSQYRVHWWPSRSIQHNLVFQSGL